MSLVINLLLVITIIEFEMSPDDVKYDLHLIDCIWWNLYSLILILAAVIWFGIG